MYYVYLLKNEKTKEIYYGYTNDLDRRLLEHNMGHKWKLIYYEAYLSESDATTREIKLKHYGQTRTRLKNRLKESLKD
jgi:predicted GIY-YIG superfamily endonuclease